jgi:hypothetical protein
MTGAMKDNPVPHNVTLLLRLREECHNHRIPFTLTIVSVCLLVLLTGLEMLASAHRMLLLLPKINLRAKSAG